MLLNQVFGTMTTHAAGACFTLCKCLRTVIMLQLASSHTIPVTQGQLELHAADFSLDFSTENHATLLPDNQNIPEAEERVRLAGASCQTLFWRAVRVRLHDEMQNSCRMPTLGRLSKMRRY